MAATATCGEGVPSLASTAGLSGTTSFQRKSKASGADGGGPRLLSIAGTRPSVRNGQLLVSTGLPALDQLLGGGLAVGTVLLIEEDKYNIYSPLLFKYFLAEGIVNGHTVLIASAREKPADILQFFETASFYYVALAVLKLAGFKPDIELKEIHMPLFPECWD